MVVISYSVNLLKTKEIIKKFMSSMCKHKDSCVYRQSLDLAVIPAGQNKEPLHVINGKPFRAAQR